jgi:hypothetical protein
MTTVTRSPQAVGIFFGLRAYAVTVCPLARSSVTVREPMAPAAMAVFDEEGTTRSPSSVAEVLVNKMAAYADRTEQAAEEALEEPWEAFRDYVMFLLEEQSKDLAFSDVILTTRGGSDLSLES